MANGPQLGGALIGGLLGLAGGFLGKRQATRARRRQRRAIAQADRIAAERVAQITGADTLFGRARSFLEDTFENAATSPLAEDFAKRIRAGQAARGTFGAGRLAASQEALQTSAFSQRLRQSLIPQAINVSFAPEQLRQSIAAFETPRLIAAATGGQLAGVGPPNFGPGLLASTLQGGLGGFQIGQGISQAQQFQQQLAQNQQALDLFGGGLQAAPQVEGITQSQAAILRALQGIQGLS